MDRICGERAAFTVFFEDPFWVGVYERSSGGKLTVCKVTFGGEPKDYEVYDFILKRFASLRFSPAVEAGAKRTADNPKRARRRARKQVEARGVGTKSQQALAMQREERKAGRERAGRQRQEEDRQRRFELKRQKRREKHKGH